MLSVLLTVSMLGACGGQDGNAAFTDAAAGFLEGVKNADPDQIRAFSTDGVLNDEDLEAFDAAKMEEGIYESLGIDKAILDAALQQQISELCGEMAQGFLKEYEIGDVYGENGIVSVEADLTYSYDVETVLTGEVFNEQLDAFMSKYQEENKETLLDVYMAEGEEAMYKKVLNDLMPQIVSAVRSEIENAAPITEKMILTVQKIDKEYKVTEVRSAEEAAAQSAEQSAEQSTEQPAEQSTEQPEEQSTEQSTEQPAGQA